MRDAIRRDRLRRMRIRSLKRRFRSRINYNVIINNSDCDDCIFPTLLSVLRQIDDFEQISNKADKVKRLLVKKNIVFSIDWLRQRAR